MADEVIEKEAIWFSSELRMLEAEFEKSKLQVFQDTLLCKRSMVELDLLWKNERLRKNVRVNNKLKEKDSRLQEQLESLSSELKSASSQLQTAQNSLQDEKARHQLEKKELEDKLNSEMEAKMEQQRKSASKRENLLQEELKALQNKHFKIFKEAEDLRTELSRKNVAVKTKAIQARVDVANTSTMVQVDSRTCEVGVQVQNLALADDLSRMDGDDVREVNEDLRETSETSKEKKRVTKAKGKASKGVTVEENKKDADKRTNAKTKEKTAKVKTVQKCKQVDEDKGKEIEVIHEEGDYKGKVLRKRKSSQREGVTRQNETEAMAEKQQTVTSTQEEIHLEKQSIAQMNKREEFQHEGANLSDSLLALNASQEIDAPFQYSITPRRLQKLGENNPSPKKHSGSTQNDITYSEEEEKTSKQQTEVVPKEVPQLVQGTSIEAVLEHVEQVFEDDKDGFVVNEDGFQVRPSPERSIENGKVGSEEQKSALIEEHIALTELREAKIQLQDEQGVDKDTQGHELPGVKQVNEEMRKIEKKESIRKRKAKQIKPAEEEIQEDEGNIQENSAVKANGNQGRRVLRSRAKGCHSGVKLDTKRGEKRKAFGTKTRQNRQDSVGETAVTEKCKPDGCDLKGRELTMFDKSTPETDQLPRETDMSSREIDPVVDQPRPSREIITHTPASDETSQQPEPEVLGRLNEGTGNISSHGERLRDYESDQGRLVLNVNRISTLEETTFDHCLHKDLEEGKCPRQNGLHQDQQDDNTNIAPSGQQFQDVVDDDSASKKQGSDSTEADYNTHLTQQTAKSKSRDAGRSNRDGQDPAGVSILKAASSKENAPQDRKLKSRKKRKPTSSVREALAPADQQSNSDCRTSSTEISSMLDCTKRRKTLFNSRENSLMVPISNAQISSANTTLSKSRANTGIPPSLSAFMKSFIAPKLKK